MSPSSQSSNPLSLSVGQVLGLLIPAAIDRRLTVAERAGALAELSRPEYEVRRQPVPGLLSGPFLTDAGLAEVRRRIPAPDAALFPRVVEDVVRRLRGKGCACTSVSSAPVKKGWSVSWEGDGWAFFSRGAPDKALAEANRELLTEGALAVGLVLEAEAYNGMTFLPREREIEVADRDEDELFRTSLTTLDRLTSAWDRSDPMREARLLLSRLSARRVMTSGEVEALLADSGNVSQEAAS